MTKRKLNIAELQEQSFATVLNNNNESHLLGGDWWSNFCRDISRGLSAQWHIHNPTPGKNIHSASVEM